ncbi:MAG: hypothetical protein KDI80_17275, partial [Xanthomonadales bacterium]|nr:hypothetical protein [Xanthomonadales bacterium]
MRVLRRVLLACASLSVGSFVTGQAPKGWPEGVEAVEVARGEGESPQPALWWAPPTAQEDDAEPVPLVV